MDKIIYEFYYIVGDYGFNTCYNCVVDKETNKMLYGDVFYKSGAPLGRRFAINKENLNQIHRIFDKTYGLIYRVQVEANTKNEAETKAKQIIY